MRTETPAPAPGAYPVRFSVDQQLTGRNKKTVGFRIILAIPQIILVGGPGFAATLGFPWWLARRNFLLPFAGGSALGSAAGATAVISWFAIVFTGRQPRGLWDFTRYFMRWRTNVIAYAGLLRDEYPPFADGEYPARYEIDGFPDTRDRWSVGLRLIFAIPHAIILFFLSIAWVITAIISWFAILFTGNYPDGLYTFAAGYFRWSVRVESYLLLMRDEYPPFSFD